MLKLLILTHTCFVMCSLSCMALKLCMGVCVCLCVLQVPSRVHIYMYTVNQVLLIAFEFKKSIELQFMEFYFGEMAC